MADVHQGMFGHTSTLGQSSLFGMPSTDHSMNEYYLQQSMQHAQRFPTPQSQAQVAYWQQVVAAGRAAQAAAAQAAAQATGQFQVPLPMPQGGLQAPQGASSAQAPPVPPVTAGAATAATFNQASSPPVV